MSHFQYVHFVGNGIGCVIGCEGGAELCNDFAAVADGRNVVDGDAGLCVAGSLHGFVNMMPPHAFAAVAG